MTSRKQLNMTRSKVAQIRMRRVRSVLSDEPYRSPYWQPSTSRSSTVTNVPQLFKVEMRPLGDDKQKQLELTKPTLSLTESLSQVKNGVWTDEKQKLFTDSEKKKSAIDRKRSLKLSTKLGQSYQSAKIRKSLAPEADEIKLSLSLQAQNDLTQAFNSHLNETNFLNKDSSLRTDQKQPLHPDSQTKENQGQFPNPIKNNERVGKYLQSILSYSKRYFDLVKIKPRKSGAEKVQKSSPKQTKFQSKTSTSTQKRPKTTLDIVANVVIALAAVFSVVYLGPYLLFDVLKLNADDRQTTSQVSLTDEQLAEKTMNARAGEFMAEDLPELAENGIPGQVGSEAGELNNEQKINDLATLTNVAVDTGEAALKQPTPPPIDESLPEGEWIIIDKIGLNGLIRGDSNLEEALTQGVVQISGYGEVGKNNGKPVILAAHRFGYKWWWNSDYARENSFYYLPELEVGDRVTIIKDQRAWTYEIYDSYEGTMIDSYQADLILYTCRYLNSDIRYFKYARLVENP